MSETQKQTHSSSTNPYVPKGDGDEAVQVYISAMLGWKNTVGKLIDETVEGAFPGVRKQVRWNTPFYGKDDGWFLAMYCYKNYVQISFLTGSALDPMPPKPSKVEGTRYLDIYEGDQFDRQQITNWVQQALILPGQHL